MRAQVQRGRRGAERTGGVGEHGFDLIAQAQSGIMHVTGAEDGPPLPVGSTGEAEFFDFELTRALPAEEVAPRLSAGLPDGLRVLAVNPLTTKRSPSAIAEDITSQDSQSGPWTLFGTGFHI